MRQARTAVILLLSFLLLGCSQVDALAPVGGDQLTEVRFAAIDVLVDHQIEIMVAPVCEAAEDGAVTCGGETVSGESITVESTAADQATMTIMVGPKVLYSGPIQEVLDSAAKLPQ